MLQICQPRNHLRSLANGNHEADSSSSKRKRSIAEKDLIVPKRLCKDSKVPSSLQNESREDLSDELDNTCQSKQYIPHHLIVLMYRIDLSVLCSLRKSLFNHKYPSLSLAFEDSDIDKFSNIVFHNEKSSIHIQIENVDKYYTDNDINYAKLFSKGKQGFSINNYFDNFVKHLITKIDRSLNDIEYLIIYTNSGLELTEENKLKKGRSTKFYPFKFESVNLDECEILKDFLFTNDSTQGRGFYKFSQLHDETTREELLKKLEFSSAMQKAIKERKLSKKKIKKAFLDKLIFVVGQPNREELNSIIKSEIKENSKDQCDYKTLQERILRNVTTPGEHKKPSGVLYEFNLLMICLHDMFLHRNMLSLSFEGKNRDISYGISINYKNRISYLKAHNADCAIGFSQLFPSKKDNRKNKISINKLFGLFVEGLKNDMRYFIIYTNAGLDLTVEKALKKGNSANFYPLKFDSIDIRKKRFKVLRGCSCINEYGLYQFAREETTRDTLLSLLELPSSLQREIDENDLKEKFLDRLIFATNQPNRKELKNIIKDEIDKSDVPYNYEELYEIALRWSESHEFGHVTKEIMEKLLEDIKNNRSSYQKIQNENLDKEIQFAKNVVRTKGTPAFNNFFDFLTNGDGKECLEVLKRNEINLANMSSILHGAGINASKAFKSLYDLWFDGEGHKTQYLKALEENAINLSSMSSILSKSGANGPRAFKQLYDLWFDKHGNKTQYLTSLEENGTSLANISSILHGAGGSAPTAAKEFYNFLFDRDGKKTRYLIKLEENGVDLVRVSSILSGVGTNAAKAFKELYDLWFDEDGNKMQYLESLESEGVKLSNVSSILGRAGANAAKAFKELCDLWFDRNGKKTRYLIKLEENGIDLVRISSIISGVGTNAAKAFKELIDLWFDADGNKTQYLKSLEENGMSLANMSNILHRSRANAAKAFKELYDLWFDRNGKKTRYLKTLEKEGVNLTSISSILGGAGGNAAKAFKELYDLWIDADGNKTQHLEHFVKRNDGEENFLLHNLSGMLCRAGANAKDAFKNLHDLCFNESGERSEYLDDFYRAGFKSSNLSCLLCSSGVRTSLTLKKFHSLCFDEKGEKTKILDDLFRAGFRPCDLCSILSGATDSIKKFHNFCFIAETKKYLDHFLNEKDGFTPSNLSGILHGAKGNICIALKSFHDVCFDETGKRTQLLNDFYKEGFKPKYLANVLSLAGNNAAKNLRNFHTSCFEENYLNHFLAEKKVFTPTKISRKILYGVGINVSATFKKFHDLCFDKAGNKTEYLNSLIRNNRHDVISTLYEEVRGVAFTSFDSKALQQ